MIAVFCISPALFYEVQLAVKLRKENSQVSLRLDVLNECGFSLLKIRLIEKNTTATARSLFIGTLESLTFSLQVSFFEKATFNEDSPHSFEFTSKLGVLVVRWEIK